MHKDFLPNFQKKSISILKIIVLKIKQSWMETQYNKIERKKEEGRKLRNKRRREMHFTGKCIFKSGDPSYSLIPTTVY